jgi:hypothetical protein
MLSGDAILFALVLAFRFSPAVVMEMSNSGMKQNRNMHENLLR